MRFWRPANTHWTRVAGKWSKTPQCMCSTEKYPQVLGGESSNRGADGRRVSSGSKSSNLRRGGGLKSGNLFYFRKVDQQSQGGIEFIVHKSRIGNITSIGSVSSRVAYKVRKSKLRVSKRYSLKVTQVYALTSVHPDEEVMYKDVSQAIHPSQTHFNVVMEDFKAKLAVEWFMSREWGNLVLGKRNCKGQRQADFMEKEGLFLMNSFFQKPPQRKWIWLSPDGVTWNELDFILTDKRQILNNVSVINRVKTGSDHRMVRGLLNIDVKRVRLLLMKSTLRPSGAHINDSENRFELQNHFDCLQDCVSVDEISNRLVETVHTVGSKFFRTCRKDWLQKLFDHTLKLMQIDAI
ncbi:craniofacial development protein 2-like [Hyposmocoma kahamanoa]|uniref:craniofacial development protein 2-like n=1 Tax=Hyposmocoma kahamanoa TaxID=1477025 RepID=UPI000E6D7054|nr:craniofacial development protein 2-like [Hyposmocoma kahamanoa]